MADGSQIDEIYAQFQKTGPEYHGWLSNHGPMAADALIHLNRADAVQPWVSEYVARLEQQQASRWPISKDDWREGLGDASRIGDWIQFFNKELSESPWREVLVTWWPRLLTGGIAAAGHGLIRTGHVVRALMTAETPERVAELAQALAYWAGRWQQVPAWEPPSGSLPADTALRQVVPTDTTGGIRGRLMDLSQNDNFPKCVGTISLETLATNIPRALDELTDAAVDSYLAWGHGNPIMLVHMATAPRAASLVLPAIPQELWIDTYNNACAISCALASIYRPRADEADLDAVLDLDDVVDQAVETRDEHAIKFVEVAVEAHRRGLTTALAAASKAVRMLTPALQ